MATTTYTVFANDIALDATFTKKAKAVDAANAARDEQRVAVRVETGSGTVVHDVAAPKKIKMSKPYTRAVGVAEDVAEQIDGKRVAYKRGRAGAQFALLDANWTGEGNGTYSIWDIDRGETVEVEIATTREAGRWFADERVAYRAAHPVVVAD